MNLYKIADLLLSVENAGKTLYRLMEPYKTNEKSEAQKTDITMCINRAEMMKSKVAYSHLSNDEWEYIQTGHAFACKLLDFDGFCLHSSAIVYDGRAYLFSGPSGRGKSTHTNLWQQFYGQDKAVIINDDKPALRMINDVFYTYGTPWSGKDTINTNICVPLEAIVFLEQASENNIRCLESQEAVKLIIHQSMRQNNDINKMNKLLTLIDCLLQTIPIYQMKCNISLEAVEIASKKIIRQNVV